MGTIWNHILNNFWSILGVLVSGIGLLFAFLQLKKIATKTTAIDETYKKTISELESNETLTNISASLQKIENIKHKIQDNKFNELKNDLAYVAKILVTLQSSLSSKIKELNLDDYKQLCSDLEVEIISSEEVLDKSKMKDQYVAFSNLELILTKVQAELKYNKN
ncbi:hypothetical protein [Tenacibaculum sp. 190524A05c]|uniref:Uncharacterized protein n=1 Tax=Tenacibaculum platacis TaxID=3137852 RepID=A0ABM9P660_9FLAO